MDVLEVEVHTKKRFHELVCAAPAPTQARVRAYLREPCYVGVGPGRALCA